MRTTKMLRLAGLYFFLLFPLAIAGCSPSEPSEAEEFRKLGARTVVVEDGKLIELNLAQSSVKDADLAKLADCKDLIHLDLGLCKITDAGMDHVGKLTQLETLTVDSNANITDAGIAKLEPLKKLKTLMIGQNKITNESLKTAASLPQLEKLSVAIVPAIDDAGMVELDGLKNLNEIWIPDTSVTPEGVKHLEEKHPGIVVHGVESAEEEE